MPEFPLINSDGRNKFRSRNNQYLLKSLFFEERESTELVPLYTLKDKDHLGYPSLKRLYLEELDPTEYRFATKYLDGLKHWETLCQCKWFLPYLAEWRYELELKMKSIAIARIMAEARNEGKNSFTANKWLAEKQYIDKTSKGRPTKQAVKEEARRIAEETFRVNSDYERIMGETTDGNEPVQ